MPRKPDPVEWSTAYARVQRVADREVLALLQRSFREIEKMLRVHTGTSISELIRVQQFKTIQRSMLQQQAAIWRQLGDVIKARRLDAAARAINLGSVIDSVLFSAAGSPQLAEALRLSFLASAEHTVEIAVARMTASQLPLSQRIYKSNVWINSRVNNMINQALAEGLNAREFAARARAWFDPNVPGGTRYAALRLSRTEINNAFHAITVANAADKPWVEDMQWHLSRSHPKPDICDQYAHGGTKSDGRYKPNEVPSKPHPHCFCFVTPEVVPEDEFLDNLVGGRYNDYLDQQIRQH